MDEERRRGGKRLKDDVKSVAYKGSQEKAWDRGSW